MTEAEQKAAAKEFVIEWKNKGHEKAESQPFWLSLLSHVFGVHNPEQFIHFEEKVHIDKNAGFIDGYIDATHVMIEQKGANKDLHKPIKQSDGTRLTPFQQAKRYSSELPYSEHPRWIVTCNLQEFLVYDMERPLGEPEQVLLKDLAKDYYRLQFLVDTGDKNIKKEMEISKQAGELVGILYDAFLKQYGDEPTKDELKSLNVLCVRLVFCLYAEDAGIFGRHGMFHDYLSSCDTHHMRKALLDLFQTLNTKPENRDKFLETELAQFPYVNGGLFASQVEIPPFTDEIRDILLNKASTGFDWSEISPTIFGAMFESTLNPETRHSGGMHYTSIENIHKLIDPLFLDNLKVELKANEAIKVVNTQKQRLHDFQNKIAGLTFFDPACGSGNFLTETYLSLRRLENKVIEDLTILDTDKHGKQTAGQIRFGDNKANNPIKVSISHFYGIEINDFAVTVAKTALWIAESQTMQETEQVIHMSLNFLPLKTNANIHEGNALQLDWESIAPRAEVNYIIGNPPFVGKKEQTTNQKKDLVSVFTDSAKGIGNLDYVSGWYKKAAVYISCTSIYVAFVSTNSITQGEQVPILWKQLLKDLIHIDFAYRTFRWNSEASEKAHVHCVIIGFSQGKSLKTKRIFMNDSISHEAKNINPYLVDAPTVLIKRRSKPLCNVPKMNYGSMPIDNGHLILDKSDIDKLLSENPQNSMLCRRYAGGEELLNNKERWCLWLQDVPPQVLQKSKFVMERIKQTKESRERSRRPQTKAAALTPYLFGEIRQPDSCMLVFPKVSSEKRKYIPISFVEPKFIISGSALVIPNANLYMFGVLISNVHNAWMRTVAGRMKSDYQYSGSIVYNTFPWPTPIEQQKAKIEQTAQAILDARALYPNLSLANLYDEVTMPPELRKAHQNNDRAVMQSYGFDYHTMTEPDCVAELMKMYQKLASKDN